MGAHLLRAWSGCQARNLCKQVIIPTPPPLPPLFATLSGENYQYPFQGHAYGRAKLPPRAGSELGRGLPAVKARGRARGPPPGPGWKGALAPAGR